MLISCLFLGAADCFGEVGVVGHVRRNYLLRQCSCRAHKKSPRDDGFSQGIMLSQSANVAIIGYLVQMSLNICTYICCGVSAFAKRHLIGAFYYYHSHRGMCRKVAEYATTSGYVIHFISAN